MENQGASALERTEAMQLLSNVRAARVSLVRNGVDPVVQRWLWQQVIRLGR
jgi:hypothetical protein